MQACGHDIHMTVFTGTPDSCGRRTGAGTLVFIGQPAEELGTGARAMLHRRALSEIFPNPTTPSRLHDSASLPAAPSAPSRATTCQTSTRWTSPSRPRGSMAPIRTPPSTGVLAAPSCSTLAKNHRSAVEKRTPPGRPGRRHPSGRYKGHQANIFQRGETPVTLRSYSDGVREHTLAAIRRICRGDHRRRVAGRTYARGSPSIGRSSPPPPTTIPLSPRIPRCPRAAGSERASRC